MADDCPPHRQPGEVYPRVPDNVRIADDGEIGGVGFLYRPGEVLVARTDLDAVRKADPELLAVDDPVSVTEDLVLLTFRTPPGVGEPDALDLVRRLRATRDEGRPGGLGVSVNHVLGIASHIKWSPGLPPRPAADPRLPRPDGPEAPGTGVTVGVVDTGIEDRPFLQGRWTPAAAEVDEELDENGNDHLDFEAGHGTFITGIILQQAPGAKIVVQRLSDKAGLVSDSDLVALVRAALDVGVDILSISFGCHTMDNLPTPALCSFLREQMIGNPELVVVAAAGNNSVDQPFWPAAMKGVVAVGALATDRKRPADFSNFGGWVDAWAPGQDVISTFLEWPPGGSKSPIDGILDPPPLWPEPQIELGPGGGFDGWASWSGTSFAAPYVAGVLAATMQPGSVPARQAVFEVVTNAAATLDGAALVP